VRTTDRKDRVLVLGIQDPDEVGLRHRANARAMVAGLTGMLGHSVMAESPQVMATPARNGLSVLSVPNALALVGVLEMGLLGVVLVRMRHAVKADRGALKPGKVGRALVALVVGARAVAALVMAVQSVLIVHAEMRLDETERSLVSIGAVVGRVLIEGHEPGPREIGTSDQTAMRRHATMIHR
jgi:hypothetical protein